MYSGCLFHRSLNTIECQLCTDHGYRPLDNTRTHSSYLQLAKGAQKRWRGLFLSHATRPLKSNTTAEIQATIWQYNLLWKERKSIILYIKAGFLILGNDFGLCKACSIYLLPENDPGTNNVFNLSASFNPELIRLASLRGFILETVVFSVKRQQPNTHLFGGLGVVNPIGFASFFLE